MCHGVAKIWIKEIILLKRKKKKKTLGPLRNVFMGPRSPQAYLKKDMLI